MLRLRFFLLLACFFCAGASIARAQAVPGLGAIDPNTDPAEWEESLKAAAAARPTDLAAGAAYARALNRLGRPDEAVLILRALDDAHAGATALYWAETDWLRGQPEAARRRLAGIPAQPLAPWAAAQALRLRIDWLDGKTTDCETAARALLARDPLSREARLTLTRLLTRRGRFAEAAQHLDALATANTDLEVTGLRVELLDAQGRDTEALTLARSVGAAIAANPPQTVEALLGAASALRRCGELHAASQCLDLAGQFSPADPFFQLERIRLFRRAWSVDEAQGRTREFLERYPACAMAWAEQAENLWQLHLNLDGVIASCEKALALDPTLCGARHRLIECRLIGAQWGVAEALLAQGRAINPTDPAAARLAQALESLRRAPAPAADTATTATTPTRDAQLAALLGEIALARSNYAGAQNYYAEALQAAPDDPLIQKGAGVAALRGAREGDAMRLLEAAFTKERYDIEIKNLLDVLDEMKASPQLQDGPVSVGYPEGHEGLARWVAAAAQAALTSETQRYGLASPPAIRVQLCPAADSLKVLGDGVILSCCCGRSTLGREGSLRFDRSIYLWTPQAGGAQSETYRLDEALFRSVAHIAVAAAFTGQAPLWLREGLAGRDTLERDPEWSPVALDILISALRDGMELPLGDLESILTSERNPFARTYAALLVREWSEPAQRAHLDDFLTRIRRGEAWPAALEAAFGQKTADLDAATRAAILKRYAALRPDRRPRLTLAVAEAAAAQSPEARLELARIFLAAKRFADASQALAPLLSGEAPPTPALLFAGRAAAGQGDWPAAHARLKQAFALESARHEASACNLDHEAFGLACLKLNQPEAAHAAFLKALELDPLDPRNDAGAGAELRKLLGANEPKPAAYYQFLAGRLPAWRADAGIRLELGRWHEGQGRIAEALACYRSAAGIQPEWAELQRVLAPLALQQGCVTEAWRAYTIVHLASPADTAVKEKLDDCARRLGHFEAVTSKPSPSETATP